MSEQSTWKENIVQFMASQIIIKAFYQLWLRVRSKQLTRIGCYSTNTSCKMAMPLLLE